MAVSSCPPPDVLRRFLLGRIAGPEADALESHLSTCRDCPGRLGPLPAEDDLVAALRPPLVADGLPGRDLAEKLTPVLARLAGPLATLAYTPETSGTLVLGSAVRGDPLSATLPPSRADDATTVPVAASADVTAGDRLGPYRVLELLGAGGMGTVWKAEDTALKRHVALKVIARSLVGRAEVRERFLAEAQALAQLEHDHIVAVYQIAEDRDIPYLAMQLLRGETLHDRLAAGPLPIDDALRVGRETALGLGVAHRRGLVHRDIKPGNLFLDAQAAGRVKILDFGLVRALSDEHGGQVIGTPAYMAPEQAASQPVDGRADLFALGCVLYHATTGRMPFQSDTILGLLIAVSVDQPSSPRSLNPKVPAALDRLIAALMAKKPEDRPQTADEVVETIATIERSRRPSYTRRWLLGAGLALVGGVGLGTWAAMVWFPPPADPPPSPPLRPLDQHLSHRGWPVKGLAVRATPTGPVVLSVSEDRTLVAWEPTTGKKPTFAWHRESPLRCLALSPDGRTLATGSGDVGPRAVQAIQLWDAESLERRGGPLKCEHPVSAVAVSPDAKWRRLVSGENDGTVKLWDATLPDGVVEFEAKRDHGGQGCHVVLFLPGGKRWLTAGGDGQVVVRDGDDGTLVRRWAASAKAVRAAVLLPDGSIITAGLDGWLRVWKLDQEKAVRERETPSPVQAVAVSPGCRRLLTGHADGTLRRWSLELEPEPPVVEAHPDGVTCVAWLADGRRAVSGGADGAVRLWEFAE